MSIRRIALVPVVCLLGIPLVGRGPATIAGEPAGPEYAVVAANADELQRVFRRRGTVVLVPGKTYAIQPPLVVDGVLDCRGATIAARSAGERGADDPTSTLIECSESTILDGTLDCRGLVNSGVFSRGRLRLLDVTVVDYRRKGVHCVHGRDKRPVDAIVVDGLSARSQKLDPRRGGAAFQYDSSKPCKLVFLNRVVVGPHGETPRPTCVFKVAHVERLYAHDIDAGGSKIVFGENVGEATIHVRNLHWEKGGRGIDYHPDPSWTGRRRPRRLTVVEE
jgi:hypothetical protein